MKKIIFLLILIGAGYGYYYYTSHQKEIQNAINTVNEIKNSITETTNSGIDAAVKNAISGVDSISPAYYYQNRNYGTSPQKNICSDETSKTSIGAIIGAVEKYTKSATCTVDQNFPSKSFTITASSIENVGQYYCTDQSGFVGLIQNLSPQNGFSAGLKCK